MDSDSQPVIVDSCFPIKTIANLPTLHLVPSARRMIYTTPKFEIVVSYRGKEQTILLNCYLNEKEESVYEAWLGDENKKNIFYFRSGPLVEVDWR